MWGSTDASVDSPGRPNDHPSPKMGFARKAIDSRKALEQKICTNIEVQVSHLTNSRLRKKQPNYIKERSLQEAISGVIIQTL